MVFSYFIDDALSIFTFAKVLLGFDVVYVQYMN